MGPDGLLDEGAVLALLHRPRSRTMAEEVVRRIECWDRQRTREAWYAVARVRDLGLDPRSYKSFSEALRRV